MMVENDPEGQSESIREAMAELEQLHDQALTVTRSLTVELRPPVLEGGGLAEALAWLAGHMENVYGLQVEVQAEEGVRPVGDDLQELAFQMVRELLFNVVKHAEVDKALLTLERQDGACQITVADSGEGFDSASLAGVPSHESGYGLRNIRERLALFEGTMRIEAAPGEGARITLSLPCAGEGREAGAAGDG